MATAATRRPRNWYIWSVSVLLAAGLLGTQAQSQEPKIIEESKPVQGSKPAQMMSAGRYSMTPTTDGFLRLDTKTGAVSLCVIKKENVLCQPGADERAALEAEIARLSRKNADLENSLKSARKSTGQRLREILPSDKDMDKALTYAERLMRRMMRIMREEEKRPDKI